MSKKFLNTKLGKRYRTYTIKIVTLLDVLKDLKICHKSLAKTIISEDIEETGAKNSEAIKYWALDDVMGDLEFKASDSFIDVGCGKGRVLAYMIYKKHPCSINGVELKKDIADICTSWTKSYDNVNVMCSNAFEIDHNNYTHLFMYNPFTQEFLYNFIELLESQLNHSVKLIFFGNNIIYKILSNRKCWSVDKKGKTFMRGPFCINYNPQRYAIYTYNPNE